MYPLRVFTVTKYVIVFLCGTAAIFQSILAEEVVFRRHLINGQSEFSAAAALDVNGDGKLDIVSGGWWYANPTWERHRLRDVELIGNRFDDYSNLPMDVDGDGDVDLVSINYRSRSLYWVRNPGVVGKDWEKVVIDTPGPSETGFLADLNGDGTPDLLPNGTKFAAWYERAPLAKGATEVKFLRHDLPEEMIGHGIGAGDINGDGRVDLVAAHGWAECPAKPATDRWIFHADFQLARDCSVPIICTDVDHDGDTDIIWGRGHNIGLYWTEQRKFQSSDKPAFRSEHISAELSDAITSRGKWVTHAIDTSWSGAHALMQGDIDGNGTPDLVAGKRFQGHDGRDPRENDPLAIYWYEYSTKSRTWLRHSISIGAGCAVDLDPKCVDVDRDGDLDILAAARSGLYLLENLRIASNDARREDPKNGINDAIPEYADHADAMFYLEGDKNADAKKVASKSPLDVGFRREHIRHHMQQVMGQLPQSNARVPLDVEVLEAERSAKYTRIKLTYASEGASRVPAFLLVPHAITSPAPAMLCLHPTNFQLGKAQICGLGGTPSRFYAHELADKGFVCLAPDYPGFGDYKYDFATDGKHFQSGTMKAIWDNVRGIDLLEQLPIVRRDSIGCIGHSLGGHNALFTAAFDGRLRCVVSSCGFNAFQDYYAGNLTGWTSDRYMPRIRTVYNKDPQKMPFDFGEVLVAISQRPIFVNAPLGDANFAVAGVRKCQATAEPVYKLLGADKDLTFVYPDAQHDFPDGIRAEAYEWLTTKLRGSD